MLLAIDTATRCASIALYDGTRVLSEESWRTANYHTVELMPAIVRMVERQQLSVEALTAVGVSLGPGSFTGLRIGLGAAKGLALAREIPLLGLPTLKTVAYPHFDWRRGAICAVVEAGRGRLSVGFYRRHRGRLLSDVGYARLKGSRKRLARHFKEASKALSAGDYAECYSWLERALIYFIGDKLNVETTGMLTEEIVGLLARKDVPEQLRNEVRECLEYFAYARFAPQTGADEDSARQYLKKCKKLAEHLDSIL